MKIDEDRYMELVVAEHERDKLLEQLDNLRGQILHFQLCNFVKKMFFKFYE